MPSAAFIRFWRTDLTRDSFLSYAAKEDCQALRLVCHSFNTTVAPHIFSHIILSFDTNSFTRLARMAALERIGRYVRTFSFHMPHTPDTFLAPLLDPVAGEEQTFIYGPSLDSSRPWSSTPKYGTSEMNDILVRQYPPIFHAATNISSFIRAFNAIPFLRHLRISCPGQPSGQRYRRDAVDYALISLRIALERVVLPDLDTLSLQPIHPAAVFYLRPQLGFGGSPASSKRWRNIRNLTVEMDSFSFGTDSPSDHLKILHSYLQAFTSLESLVFRWRGLKGPSPLSLHTEPCVASTTYSEATTKPPFGALKFRHLKKMLLQNVIVDAVQISAFIMSHRKVLHGFEFQDVHFRSGNWDDALAPLTRTSGNENLKPKQEEVMDVPLFLSPETKCPSDSSVCLNQMMWAGQKEDKNWIHTVRKAMTKKIKNRKEILARYALDILLHISSEISYHIHPGKTLMQGLKTEGLGFCSDLPKAVGYPDSIRMLSNKLAP